MDPLVSVVLPVYNGELYLGQAIDSVLAQTYPSIELIVVNDGSDDRGETERIALSYGPRVRYFTKPNGGVATALNLGIREMKGEWFAWLSHDDVFDPRRVETDMRLAGREPAAQIVFCPTCEIDASGVRTGATRSLPQRVNSVREALLLGGVDMCAMTIRRSCLDAVGPFDEGNRTAQDVSMSLHLAAHFPFYLNAEGLVLKRRHPGQGSAHWGEERQRDLRRVAEFLHREVTFEEMFGGSFPDRRSRASGLLWLADTYRFLGHEELAREEYRHAARSAVSPGLWLDATLGLLEASRSPGFLGRAAVRCLWWGKGLFRHAGGHVRHMRNH